MQGSGFKYSASEVGLAKSIVNDLYAALQWNLINTDTKGTCHNVRFIRVSILSRLSGKEKKKKCHGHLFY